MISSLSSVEYFQYIPLSKIETASNNPYNKNREPFQNSLYGLWCKSNKFVTTSKVMKYMFEHNL